MSDNNDVDDVIERGQLVAYLRALQVNKKAHLTVATDWDPPLKLRLDGISGKEARLIIDVLTTDVTDEYLAGFDVEGPNRSPKAVPGSSAWFAYLTTNADRIPVWWIRKETRPQQPPKELAETMKGCVAPLPPPPPPPEEDTTDQAWCFLEDLSLPRQERVIARWLDEGITPYTLVADLRVREEEFERWEKSVREEEAKKWTERWPKASKKPKVEKLAATATLKQIKGQPASFVVDDTIDYATAGSVYFDGEPVKFPASPIEGIREEPVSFVKFPMSPIESGVMTLAEMQEREGIHTPRSKSDEVEAVRAMLEKAAQAAEENSPVWKAEYMSAPAEDVDRPDPLEATAHWDPRWDGIDQRTGEKVENIGELIARIEGAPGKSRKK